MALVVTPGDAAANSYVSISGSNLYFQRSLRNTTWGAVDDEVKEQVLAEATRLLDSLVAWKGYRATDTQSLQWPRVYVRDPDNWVDSYISETTIPKFLEAITCELAYDLNANSGYVSDDSGISKVKIGSIAVDFKSSTSSSTSGFPLIVRDMISKWGDYSPLSSSSIRQVGLVRV
jgi:hypothetical protein